MKQFASNQKAVAMVFFILSVAVLASTVSCNGNKKKIAWLSFFFFSTIYLFLRKIGTDWIEYEKYYNNQSITDFFAGFFELGFSIVLSFFKFFEVPYSVAAATIALATCIIYFVATNKHTENFGLITLLASFYIFYPGLESIRQLITIVIFYYSLLYIDIDWKKYFSLNLIGLLFHRSGIFTLLFYFFWRYKVIKVGYFIVLLLYKEIEGYIYKLLAFFPSIYQKYYWYRMVQNSEGSFELSLKLIEYLLLAFITAFISARIRYSEKTKQNDLRRGIIPKHKENNVELFRDMIFMGIGLQLFVQPIMAASYRLLYYSDIGVMLAFCYLYEKLPKTYKIVGHTSAVVYIFLRFYRLLSVNLQLFQ